MNGISRHRIYFGDTFPFDTGDGQVPYVVHNHEKWSRGRLSVEFSEESYYTQKKASLGDAVSNLLIEKNLRVLMGHVKYVSLIGPYNGTMKFTFDAYFNRDLKLDVFGELDL